MSLPYFPLYPTDFEADTSHLTLEEDGAYNRLMRLMWMTPGCSLPDDDRWIMRRMRVDQPTYDRVVLVIIEEFLVRKSGRIFSPRLAKEWQKTDLAHRKRVDAGKQGGLAKARKTNEKTPSNAVAKPKQPEPEPEPDNIDLDKSKSCSFSDFWKDWPNKVGKVGAERAWKRLSVADRISAVDRTAGWFERWRGANPDASPIHPASYLNQKRWNDEFTPNLRAVGGSDVDRDTAAIDAIKTGKHFLCTNIPRSRAERLVHEGRVTVDEIKAVRII